MKSKMIFLPLLPILLVFFFLEAKKIRQQKKPTTNKITRSSKGLFIAPDFTLLDDQGSEFTLSSLRGKKVALYFYPKDGTPGCTKQACSIRDGFSELKNAGIEVIGLSYGSHAKFKKGHRLPFRILKLTKHVAKLYDVQGLFGFPKRITYLINEDGNVSDVIKDIDTAHHADQILEGFGTQA